MKQGGKKRQRTPEEIAARKAKKGAKKVKNRLAGVESEFTALAAQFGMSVDADGTTASMCRGSSTGMGVKAGATAKNVTSTNDLLRAVLGSNENSLLPVQLTRCSFPGCASTFFGDGGGSTGPANLLEHTAPCGHAITLRALERTPPDDGANVVGAFDDVDDLQLEPLIRAVRCARGAAIAGSHQWSTSAVALVGAELDDLRAQQRLQQNSSTAPPDGQYGSADGESGVNSQAANGLVDLMKMQRAHVKLRAALDTTVAGSNERRVRLICHLDHMYYELYYAALCHFSRNLPWAACEARMRANGALSPSAYLRGMLQAYDSCGINVQALCDKFVSERVQVQGGKALRGKASASLRTAWADVLGHAAFAALKDSNADHSGHSRSGGRSESVPIELLRIYRYRWREGMVLFSQPDHSGIALIDKLAPSMGRVSYDAHLRRSRQRSQSNRAKMNAKWKAGNSKVDDSALVEVPCCALLQLWRDTARNWGCHLFAYAVPTAEALDAIERFSPNGVCEIGAGTGYWASLLHARGVDIAAFDLHPQPSRDQWRGTAGNMLAKTSDIDNEYHGRVPAFTAVEQGDSKVLHRADMCTRSLLLCYPPPGPMAATTLDQFARNGQTGNTVIYIGECSGDTADKRFEDMLQQHYSRMFHCPLPNWGNTAVSLTVWRQREPAPGTVAQAICSAESTALDEVSAAMALAKERDAVTELEKYKSMYPGRLRTAFVKSKKAQRGGHRFRVRWDNDIIAEEQHVAQHEAKRMGAVQALAALAELVPRSQPVPAPTPEVRVNYVAQCAFCGAAGPSVDLRRCVISRAECAIFCSAACAKNGEQRHRAELAMRLAIFDRALDFHGVDFEPLRV